MLKVIFENCYLEKTEIELTAAITKHAFLDSSQNRVCQKRFFKTSTGFANKDDQMYKNAGANSIGAEIEDVKLMHAMAKVPKGAIGIKPSGGIHTLSQALDFFQACGAPFIEGTVDPDPMRFRLGSSSLLRKNATY